MTEALSMTWGAPQDVDALARRLVALISHALWRGRGLTLQATALASSRGIFRLLSRGEPS